LALVLGEVALAVTLVILFFADRRGVTDAKIEDAAEALKCARRQVSPMSRDVQVFPVRQIFIRSQSRHDRVVNLAATRQYGARSAVSDHLAQVSISHR
jgi:hypothetical protein